MTGRIVSMKIRRRTLSVVRTKCRTTLKATRARSQSKRPAALSAAIAAGRAGGPGPPARRSARSDRGSGSSSDSRGAAPRAVISFGTKFRSALPWTWTVRASYSSRRPSFFEPCVERRVLDGEEHPAGREGDPGFLQEVEHVLEDPDVVVVEADDHPGDHEVVGLDGRMLSSSEPEGVLPLLRLDQTLGARGLDPDEDALEVAVAQKLEDPRELRRRSGSAPPRTGSDSRSCGRSPRGPPGASRRTSGWR